MGLLSVLARALGVVPPVVPTEPGPFAVSDAARARIAALAAGTIVHVSTTPIPGGRLAVVREEALGSATIDPSLGLVIAPADRDALAGLVLEYDGARFAVSLKLRVEGRETPNPDSRLYEVDRPLARGRPRFFGANTADAPPLARRLLLVPGVVAVLFRDNAVSVEREPGVRWPVIDRAVDAALREHFLCCGEVIPEARTPAAGAAGGAGSLHARVAQVLADRVAPAIHADGGDCEVIEVADGVVRVQLVGACNTCPASEATLKLAIERTLKDTFPGEVVRVEAIR